MWGLIQRGDLTRDPSSECTWVALRVGNGYIVRRGKDMLEPSVIYLITT